MNVADLTEVAGQCGAAGGDGPAGGRVRARLRVAKAAESGAVCGGARDVCDRSPLISAIAWTYFFVTLLLPFAVALHLVGSHATIRPLRPTPAVCCTGRCGRSFPWPSPWSALTRGPWEACVGARCCSTWRWRSRRGTCGEWAYSLPVSQQRHHRPGERC